MFDLSGLSVKSPNASVAFGIDLAADAVRAQPASLNIDNFSSDHRLAKESFSGFKAPHPSLLSNIPTTEASAPQLPIGTRAMQVAGSPATAFLSLSADAFAACSESTLRRTMRARLPTVPRRGGRFTD
jgi:hypothetical protein